MNYLRKLKSCLCLLGRITFTLALFWGCSARAQDFKLYQTDNIHNQLKLNTRTGEVYQVQDDGQTFLVHRASTPDGEKPNRYVLEKTKNIWTYILLDRFTGKLWQCHYSVKGKEYILSIEINSNDLSKAESGRFTIQPMTSMYQFYLINDDTGEMWQFQWSNESAEYRWIKKVQ